MPALFLQILSYISLAAQAAKDAKPIYDAGRAMIQSWYKAGLITIQQQNASMVWADQHQAAVLAGQVPPEFTVEPDPAPVILQLPPGSKVSIPPDAEPVAVGPVGVLAPKTTPAPPPPGSVIGIVTAPPAP